MHFLPPDEGVTPEENYCSKMIDQADSLESADYLYQIRQDTGIGKFFCKGLGSKGLGLGGPYSLCSCRGKAVTDST